MTNPFTITAITIENANTKTFTLNGSLNAQPGQFVMVWLPRVDEKPFSLAAADPVTLTIAAVGPFSRAIHRLRVGDRLWLRGPLGHGFTLPESPAPQPLMVIGGGYGAAPLFFLAQQALQQKHAVIAILGAGTKAGLLFANRFAALGIPVFPTTEDGSAGRRGLVTDALRDLIAADTPRAVYACGPAGMLNAIADLCRPAGIPTQLSWEAYMRCGIGLCGSCEIKNGRLVCLDGPVMTGDKR